MSKNLWQITGSIAIAIILISGCNSRQPKETPFDGRQSATPLATPKDVWMSEFQQINGTPYLYAPIYVATEENKSLLKQLKSATYENRKESYDIDIRNYMFVHRDNLSSSKLLSNNSARLLKMELIGELAKPTKAENEPIGGSWIKKVNTLWYVKVPADTNGDKLLDDRDRQQIAISDVSGANYTELIKDIDKILMVYPKGIDKRLVIYTSGNRRFVADVDLIKRQTTVKELPALS